MRNRLIAFGLVAALAVPVIAQKMPMTPPGKPDVKLVIAGSYKIDAGHTQVIFQVDHLGFNPYYGTFSDASGTLKLDPAKPTAAVLEISLPIASVQTTSTKLTEELKAAQFFDAAKFPTAIFKSTKVEPTGPTSANILGNLTLHGVTRPVTIEGRFVGAGPNPMSRATTIGFEGRTKIKRSDFGVTYGIPLVSDEVSLLITAAFEKAG